MAKLSKIEELALIAKCILNDDREAFGVLVESYQCELRAFLLHLTMGDYALSDDLSQETFIKAYMGIRQFKGLSRFGTWLFRIAYNEFYEYKRKSVHETSLENAPEPAVRGGASQVEAKMDVYAAMRVLSDAERSAVTLFYLKDMSIKDVSRIMNMPENTIKSLLRRGKEKMAKELA